MPRTTSRYLLPEDDLHITALATGREITESVTTDSVFVEVLAYMSRRGRAARLAAVTLVEELRNDDGVTIVHQDAALFYAGLELYRKRLDKGYSLTDCMSMNVCRATGIDDVLTHDQHFSQEGFSVLL